VDNRPTGREEAKRIITAIIALSGGRLESKTTLFKIFYIAHLFYWRDSKGVLTTHPVARMPYGHGIDDHEALLNEMEREGLISTTISQDGPYKLNTFTTDRTADVSPDEERAICQALEWVRGKRACDISEMVHELSRTWQNGKDGEILDIYLDLLSDKEWLESEDRLESAKATLDEFYK
jgi:hypothetical protein